MPGYLLPGQLKQYILKLTHTFTNKIAATDRIKLRNNFALRNTFVYLSRNLTVTVGENGQVDVTY